LGTHRIARKICIAALYVLLSVSMAAQMVTSAGQRLIRFSGRALDAAGQPLTGVTGVTFAIYEEQSGGVPLWQETQNLATDANGRFSALLGATSATGIPSELFSSGDARWLAVLTHSPGAAEQPRVLLVSVPYAHHAVDSEMLGGKPASAYATVNSQTTACANSTNASYAPAALSASVFTLNARATPAISVSGAAAGYLPVFTDTSGNLGNSVISQSGSNIAVAGSFSLTNVGGIGIGPLSNVRLNVGGTLPSANNAFGLYMGQLTLQPSSGWDAYFHYGGGGTVDTGSGNVIRKAVGLYSEYILKAGTGQISNTYGLWINPSTSGANNYGAYIGGNVGIGTTTPDQMLTVAGAVHSTAGGFVFPDGTVMTSAATSTGTSGTQPQPDGNLVLASGNGNGTITGGNLQLQTESSTTSAVNDRLLIAGQPKAMTGAVPTANLFSIHIPTGEAAGGKVKFTIVASDGTNYAMETGEMIYLASPKQLSCAKVISKYASAPPTYTNTALAIPAIGQAGSLDAQCSSTFFGSDPGIQIFDTAPTTFTATTHKVYYTIENQSQAAITLQP